MSSELVISGTTAPGFEGVRYEFANNFLHRHELGASLAVIRGNEVLVDLWGGWMNRDKQQPWEPDSIVNVWSTTKGLVALAAHILIDRAELDLDAPVARYWPDFAQSGKSQITVKHLLSHRSGLAAWRKPISEEEIHDWAMLCDLLAAQSPWWEPGTTSGYHALTFGHLVGELVRKVDGRSIDVFIREEISQPLGAHSVSGDFFVGTQPQDDARTADLWRIPDELLSKKSSSGPAQDQNGASASAASASATSNSAASGNASQQNSPSAPAPDSTEDSLDLMATAMSSPLIGPKIANSTEWRRGVFPAANGHGSARAIASMYAALAAGGTVDGLKLVSPEAVEKMREPQPTGLDLVLKDVGKMTWGLGFMVNAQNWFGSNKRAFHHGGYGGSLGFADPEANFGFAYVMNAMNLSTLVLDVRAALLLNSVYEGLESELSSTAVA